jgi:multidrug efflux pump subunit AcrB
VRIPVSVRVQSFPATIPGDQQPPKSTPVPVIHVDIDRSKANELGISMWSIGDTL